MAWECFLRSVRLLKRPATGKVANGCSFYQLDNTGEVLFILFIYFILCILFLLIYNKMHQPHTYTLSLSLSRTPHTCTHTHTHSGCICYIRDVVESTIKIGSFGLVCVNVCVCVCVCGCMLVFERLCICMLVRKEETWFTSFSSANTVPAALLLRLRLLK